MRTLKAHVHVDGVAYKPDQRVPAEVAARITNPKAWDGDVESEVSVTETAGGVSEPPRSGRGSGAEAWIAYARSQGLEVADDTSRDDVVALVDAAKG